MKKRYTKRQLLEAIAYWKKQLKARRLDESLKNCNTLDEVYGELDDIMGRDEALKGKLAKLYKADNPGWKGEWNDDGYTNWRLDLIGPTFDRTMLKAIKAGVDRVLGDVKALVDRELGSSAWNLDESDLPPGDEEIKDQVERVMEKASDEFGSSDRYEFDRWQEEAAAEVELRIRDGGYSFDELVDVAVNAIHDLQQDYEDREADYAKGPDEPWDYEG